MSEQGQIELLPCPFCGGKATLDGVPGGVMGRIYCDNDECFGPRTTATSRESAIEQWNKRAELTSLRASQAALVEALGNACDRLQKFLDTFGDLGDCVTQADLDDWSTLAAQSLTAQGERDAKA